MEVWAGKFSLVLYSFLCWEGVGGGCGALTIEKESQAVLILLKNLFLRPNFSILMLGINNVHLLRLFLITS